MSEAELLAAILSTPSAQVKEKRVRAVRRERSKEARKVPKERKIVLTEDELKRIIEEAVQRGIREGMRLAKEVNEENVVRAVWNGEPSGVKLSDLTLVFGRENAHEVQKMLYELKDRGILVKDRNNWWHINPAHAEQVLSHYGIQFDDGEVEAIRLRLSRRFLRWEFPEPKL